MPEIVRSFKINYPPLLISSLMSQRSKHPGLSKSAIRHGFRNGKERQRNILQSGKQADRRAADAERRKRAIQGAS
jgi:hypothetical protein